MFSFLVSHLSYVRRERERERERERGTAGEMPHYLGTLTR